MLAAVVVMTLTTDSMLGLAACMTCCAPGLLRQLYQRDTTRWTDSWYYVIWQLLDGHCPWVVPGILHGMVQLMEVCLSTAN
jgi:hypothetical protein